MCRHGEGAGVDERNEVATSERPWNQDPRWNPNLASQLVHEDRLVFKGGGRLRPEGGYAEVSLSVGNVGLELDHDGGRLFPASRFASFGVRLIAFGVFSEIRFTWRDVQRVERMQGWAPWDRGVKFKLRDGGQFVFSSLLGERLQTILNYAEAHGASVDNKQGRTLT
jgi:hypothetical protein